MKTSVSFFGCVYQSPSKASTIARRAVDVELGDLVGAPEVQVDRPGWTVEKARSASTGPISSPEERSTTATESSEAERSEISPAGKARPARQVAAVAAAAQLAGADQRVGALAPAVAEDLVVGAAGLLGGAAERRLVGGGEQVGGLDPLVRVVEDRRLDRPLEELVRVAAEELVERVLAGDVEGDPLAAPPRPAPHLAQAGDGAGEGDADRRVELADVDPELERVGGDHGEQLAAREPGLDLAPLLRRVAGAVGRDPRRQRRARRAPRGASG